VADTVTGQSRIAYDSLIVAAGAGQSYFGHDEFATDTPRLKTLDNALELRHGIFGAFEVAELGSSHSLSAGRPSRRSR
jgi:NADH:ubiquinone reductase (H+-translocating)